MDMIPGLNTTACPQTLHETLVKERLELITAVWQLGALCIYAWELVICLPKEYRSVWTKPFNMQSLLYLANRYFGLTYFSFSVASLVSFGSRSACERVFMLQPVGSLICLILSQAILGGRVFAIYLRNKALGYLLGGLLLGEAIVGGIAVRTSSSAQEHPSINILGLIPPSCGVVVAPFKWLVTYWTTPLLYDSLTFSLTAWKAYSMWKRETNIPIFNIIWYDGLLYFFAISSMNIVNVMFLLFAPQGLHEFNMMPTVVFQVMLSCRMFLHLKGSNPSSSSIRNTPSSMSTQSSLRFCRPDTVTGSKEYSKTSTTSGINTKEVIVIGVQTCELDIQVKPSHEV